MGSVLYSFLGRRSFTLQLLILQADSSKSYDERCDKIKPVPVLEKAAKLTFSNSDLVTLIFLFKTFSQTHLSRPDPLVTHLASRLENSRS
jgi:hypothetical protein